MSAFEYFFGFYSIVLGLSVVEVLGGVARTIERRNTVRISSLSLLTAAFLALDLSSYWLQAWHLYRNAPLSMSVITHGLVGAGAYYLAAHLTFARDETSDLEPAADAHFWATRRWVFGLVLFTNVMNVGTIALLYGGFAFIGSLGLIAFTATFYLACAVLILAPRGKSVVIALCWLLIFSLIAISLDALRVADAGWPLVGAEHPEGE